MTENSRFKNGGEGQWPSGGCSLSRLLILMRSWTMPLSAQALYFHLGMRADDDGFVSNAKRIQKLVGAADDDLKILALKRFILVFDSGVVVIKHWKISNYIQKDRYKPTLYQEEKSTLFLKPGGAYTDHPGEGFRPCVQSVSKSDTAGELAEKSGVSHDVSTMDTPG